MVIKRAVVTAISGTTATIRFTTSANADTVAGVRIGDGLVNDVGTVRISVNDVVRVLIEDEQKRVILYRL